MKRKLAWIVVATFMLPVIAGVVIIIANMPIEIVVLALICLAMFWAVNVLMEEQ